MIVNVAGAGSGKTTQMAELVTEYCIPSGKMVFCVAFTNAAAELIADKVESKLHHIPDNIKVSTIHSFLYQELIQPFYYFLYGRHFDQISAIDLPEKMNYRQLKISELEKEGLLHYTEIPQKAKWVVYKKSNDKKEKMEVRRKLLNHFSSYCEAIIVDEAQDINSDVRIIFETLDRMGVKIVLYGDPKQDVKGSNQFREIIDAATNVNYIQTSHRCPQIHLDISNTLAPIEEQQISAEENHTGSLDIVFESDLKDLRVFLDDGEFGLKYISRKQEQFVTHKKDEIGDRFETLHYEVKKSMIEKWETVKTRFEINRGSFYVTERMLNKYDQGEPPNEIIGECVRGGVFNRLAKDRFARMANAFITKKGEKANNMLVVQSIEIVKGLQAERCLFILTPDLAPYLFRERIDCNKTKNLLYVALTRSLDNLTILITEKVESKYGREYIKLFFEKV